MTAEAMPQQRRRRDVIRATAAVAVGTLAPVLIWVIVVPVAGHQLTVKDAGHPDIVIGLPPVVAIAASASLAGWLLLALLERVTNRARRKWTVLALTVLLISFLPLAAADTTSTTRLTLTLMHLAVAAALFAAAFMPTVRYLRA